MSDDGTSDWSEATDTFVAGDGYYASVMSATTEMVQRHVPAGARVLDVGCGSGEFTTLLADRAAAVAAVDISPALLSQARNLDLPNVRWSEGDVLDPPSGRWDVVACMGVLVCVLDDSDFDRALRGLMQRVASGGLLILRESLSGWAKRTMDVGTHTARYRRPTDYLGPLSAGGFTVLEDRKLATWSRLGRRTNHLWVLRAGS